MWPYTDRRKRQTFVINKGERLTLFPFNTGGMVCVISVDTIVIAVKIALTALTMFVMTVVVKIVKIYLIHLQEGIKYEY